MEGQWGGWLKKERRVLVVQEDGQVGGNPEGLFQASLLTGKRTSWTRLLNQGSVIYASNSLQL